MELAKRAETFQKFELAGKGKLVLTRNLMAEIDYLHKRVGNIEWIGILLYTKEAGDIGDPSTLVLKADRLFLMDIGTAGHTEATLDADEVLNMYDQIPDCMNLKQGLIHTHHNMSAFFSGEDWSELNDNVPLHHYYLSLIVNHAGLYVAKVAYLAENSNEFRYKNSDNQEVVSHQKKKVMMVIDLDIIREDRNVDQYFSTRYDYIKDKVAKAKTTYFYNGVVHQGPYHTWPKEGDEEKEFKREEASGSKKEDQRGVDQKSTFPAREKGGSKSYYRSPSDTLTYQQAKGLCLDWLNEGLRMESITDVKPFNTLLEGLSWFTDYFADKLETAHYITWLNHMQMLLVEVTAEYQPSVTSVRISVQMGEFTSGVYMCQRIAADLRDAAKAHPMFLAIMRKADKHTTKEDKKKDKKKPTVFVDPWGRVIE